MSPSPITVTFWIFGTADSCEADPERCRVVAARRAEARDESEDMRLVWGGKAGNAGPEFVPLHGGAGAASARFAPHNSNSRGVDSGLASMVVVERRVL